jgi:diguanylate cyclase (GGDEF)-like protein
MNKANLFVFLLAVSPLLSYFLGRFSRALGLAAAAALMAGSAFALGADGLASGPVMALLLWTLAALAHSAMVNADLSGFGEGERKLGEAKARAARLETVLRGLKNDFAALGSSEKKALTLYSAVKLLSEAVDLESAGKQFGRYVKDYFDTSDFAFYVNDLNSNAPELFASGDKTDLSSWKEVTRLAGGDPSAMAGAAVLEAERTVIVPVLHAGAPVGLFALRSAPAAFKKDALSGAAAEFADEVSFAVKRIQLFRQVEWLSQVDGLTGVYRRNVLDEKILEEIRRASTFKTTLGFMIVDIDHFKQVNDRYGHQFGDFVLKRVGLLLRSSVYETDFVGRYGGEEFGIVLPRADAAGVLRKAEAIRTKIEGEVFSQGFETVKISVSIGIAHFPRDGSAAGELVARADAALYRAKETGRNKVVDVSSV